MCQDIVKGPEGPGISAAAGGAGCCSALRLLEGDSCAFRSCESTQGQGGDDDLSDAAIDVPTVADGQQAYRFKGLAIGAGDG